MDSQKAVIVGISGCSSSGKTTLARLLRDIFPNTFILHEDDFYKPEEQLPIKDGLVDWDCPEAISVPDMEKALSHIRSTGTFPVSLLALDSPTLSHRHDHGSRPALTSHPSRRGRGRGGRSTPLSSPSPSPLPLVSKQTQNSHNLSPQKQPSVDSKEDQNTIGECPVSPSQIADAKQTVSTWLQPGQPGSLIFPPATFSPPNPKFSSPLRICLLDGFLLYSPTHMPSILPALDIKLFLQVSHAKAVQRREARDGYVTLEGFWTDPPGYVDKIVWPNYVEAHRWLFMGGDVEGGVLDEEAMKRYGVLAQMGKGMDIEFGETLGWAVGAIMRELERIVLGEVEGTVE